MLKNKFSTFFLIITICSFGLFFPKAQAALVGNTNDATFSISPSTGTYKTNTAFSVNIMINTHGQNVVVAAAYINYNPSIIEVDSVDLTNSIFSGSDLKIAENTIDSTNGRVKLSIGAPSPGVNNSNGLVATLNIKGKTDSSPSSDNFTFSFTAGSTSDSNIIKNDGLGTDIISGVYNAKFSFDGTAPLNVTNFTASTNGSAMSLSWTNPSVDFSGVKILRKTGGFPTGPTDGTLIYDGTASSFSDTGISVGTIYYYAAYAYDSAQNYSSGATVSSSLQDSVAPSAVNNLSVSATAARSVTLTWTAVGDDANSGTASSYDLRYFTSSITTSNWSSAGQAAGEPAPKSNGNPESMTLTGLNGGTNYYFAIKVADEIGNTSGLSNVVSFKTYQTTDLNLDYYINSVDFGVLMSYWNSGSRPAADINQDGAVDSVDFGIMMSQWGSY